MSYVLVFLLAYTAAVSLCLGLERHAKQVFGKAPGRVVLRALRLLGWGLLLTSLCMAGVAWGWAMGPVGWFGMVSLAGLALVLALPYAPRLAVWAALVGVPVGVGLSVF